ncbi:hypothetical protein EDE12_106128 [Methylosinus sp. sav-2]|uniref:hypothetical protein n=1 Tax=Methylosinus sp. sav-2 TaxID=2485168 RepID=UPI00047A90C5|nr:hypothetical protein [Methylosinus sp. sav-2]TDX63983.1 hypothetical protein EDE12_106128 [Methylosinus sp. sav-2]
MPILALLPMLVKGALDALSAAVRTPIGAAAVAAGLTWLVVSHNERAACSARAEALRLELQRAADAEHARRESAIGAAEAVGRAEADALARKNLDLEIRLKEAADASAALDRSPCLTRDSVMRLERLAR